MNPQFTHKKAHACTGFFTVRNHMSCRFLRFRVVVFSRNPVLLRNRQQIVDHPVQNQPGREEKERNRKGNRQEHHHFGLHRIRWRRAHLLLDEHRTGHDNRQNVIRIRRCQILNPAQPGSVSDFNAGEKYPVQGNEDRNLNHNRQTTAQRIDFFSFVQGHQFLVHTLFVVLVSFTEFRNSRRKLLHLGHAAIAGRGKRSENQFDQAG